MKLIIFLLLFAASVFAHDGSCYSSDKFAFGWLSGDEISYDNTVVKLNCTNYKNSSYLEVAVDTLLFELAIAVHPYSKHPKLCTKHIYARNVDNVTYTRISYGIDGKITSYTTTYVEPTRIFSVYNSLKETYKLETW